MLRFGVGGMRLLLMALLFAPALLGAAELRDTIDARLEAAWKQQKIEPAAPAGDAEFLRRIYLDLLGRVPSYEEAVAFLEDTSGEKRERLIDRLLADPQFAVHQADVWDMVYFGRNPPGYNTDKREGFHQFLQRNFAENRPYNVWVGEILRAEGDTIENGAPLFFVQFSNQPEDAAEAVTQRMLGVQLQCARCHDHPFESWEQTDFFGMAAFFARLKVVEVGKKNNENTYAIGEMNQGDVLFSGPAAQQQPGTKGEPIAARFLGGEPLSEPPLPEGFKEERNFPSGKMPPAPMFSRKNALAEWVVASENPYLARAAVNRVWAQFMGKGIVEPVDNLSPTIKPSHPELLEDLANDFATSGFDMRRLIREIVNSRGYQLSSAGPVSDAHPQWYERARFRPLSAEELFESWMVATGAAEALAASGKERKGRFEAPGITWDYLRRFFGTPNDGVGNFQGGLAEHLYLNNGQVHQFISREPGSLYHALEKSEEPWEQRVERMFLQTLSRRPSEAETAKFTEFLTSDDDPRNRLHEAIWCLVSCSEFRFNH